MKPMLTQHLLLQRLNIVLCGSKALHSFYDVEALTRSIIEENLMQKEPSSEERQIVRRRRHSKR